jgi:aspartyl-tRNA(Asn)/glutamyl-tRNA(Gln) amidotransferase subunit C
MDISEKDILHLARLSKISLSPAEIPEMIANLREILGYVGKLDELELDGVEPTFQTTGLQNVWREDEVSEQISREKLLGTAPKVRGQSVEVPKVL